MRQSQHYSTRRPRRSPTPHASLLSPSPSPPMATLQLNHIARETSDVPRLAAFYEAVLGFERVPSPNYSGFQVAWLRLPKSPDVALHLIERDPAAAPVAVGPGAEGAPPSQLPRRHHLAFSVADYDGFVTGLKARGTELFEKTQPDGRTRQVFFFDPDGNGLEVTSSGAGSDK
ncbi:hypothetical protein SETIT_9G149600v2 [Setaria italica]|uniref:VOC domain-containing protein n=3 Tax=Setaria TaxID=4554 RepID=A0A368SGQ0_SETIT|nr:uncharacterized protein LOC101755397 [Setaria italica]XP_004982251.1 uncharacterized protein LOC101755397 [Setaria italica]XP_022679162.1 uncharacterized protein LOC101755397 [Setaria italica]RCV41595.1 hypothetical protein SETIT_9G149600v2 [Setaria italica]RCV41596.1 hypothetical protein SETIT_9G149600v2 [Setaria italica]RCV41597.1 hypothetical protein SETIT_9G149600v2 [Setaria italica]